MIKTSPISDVAGKARRTIIILALAVCSLLASQQAMAQGDTATATLTPSTIDITQGSSFQLTLNITTDFVSSGITYFLQVSPNGSGLFRITARDRTGAPYEDATTGDATITTPPSSVLDPVNNHDLGATNTDPPTDPPGSYFIATITLLADASIPFGTYTIFLDNRSIVTDNDGGGFEDRPISAMATINVVPEPSTVGLAFVGGAGLLFLLRRKPRTRV